MWMKLKYGENNMLILKFVNRYFEPLKLCIVLCMKWVLLAKWIGVEGSLTVCGRDVISDIRVEH